ncbi:hypothetical protein [Caballeronia terrestris]|uniref:hypothetical protein n=1 Tax=Caballeronia terrestris TaxID=1226301 RepID=UPI000F739349|nr:hypothetical protein [Caballeronia terrestris]
MNRHAAEVVDDGEFIFAGPRLDEARPVEPVHDEDAKRRDCEAINQRYWVLGARCVFEFDCRAQMHPAIARTLKDGHNAH